MHRKNRRGTGLLLALALTVLCLGPAASRGQDALGYALPDVVVPSPLGSTRPEEGFYAYGTWGMYQQTIPIGEQTVAVRGFLDIDGSTGLPPRTFVGSQRLALTTQAITGPQSQQPSHKIGFGFRFYEGGTLELNWLHINTVRYSAIATPIVSDFNLRPDLSDSFLFSPVTNFPLDFSGPGTEINGGAAFGVWNAADLMTIDYTQRNELAELVYKLPPVIDTLSWRTYGFFGPRFVWFWERFRWRSFDFDETGAGNDVWNAFYTNIISNRMYGMKLGCGNDWYWGNGFSCNVDYWATPMFNFVKKRAKYERGDRRVGPERKRSDTDYTIAAELGASVNLNWFPYEGIQIKAGYNIMSYFNTVTSQEPIDFDYSGLNPEYDRQLIRILRGFEIGICLRF